MKLNADKTFEFLNQGEFGVGRLKGTWEFVGENKIRIKAKSEEFKSSLDKEPIRPDNSGVIVTPDSSATIDQPYPTEIDEILIFKGKKLCSLDEEGNVRFCYRKLSNKTAKKLFSKE